jgi:phenylpyruvate tautomerase PptA (4-oxalocrotonate tautomerase family)
MAQVVVWGLRRHLEAHRVALSDAIHGAVMATLDYPVEKRFHRFVGLDTEDFVFPPDRGSDYTIIEISIFAGRSEDARRRLIEALFEGIHREVGIDPHSVEITITETPRVNWGIRGRNAADLDLGYRVDV